MSSYVNAKLFFGFCSLSDLPPSFKARTDPKNLGLDPEEAADASLKKFGCEMVCCGDNSVIFWGIAYKKLKYSTEYKRLPSLDVKDEYILQLKQAAEAVGWPTEDPAWHLTTMTF